MTEARTSPGSCQNEAAFYILEGRGYEVHDDKRYDWTKDDLVFVHTDSVHRHFNPYDETATALVVKAKSTWMFMGLPQQGRSGPVEGEERFGPREDWSRIWTPGVGDRKKVIGVGDTTWENTPLGRVRVMSSPERTDARIFSIDAFELDIPAGSRSGKYWKMADEVHYVLDGSGYALQWEVEAEIAEKYYARVAKEPTRHEITKGDTLYVPQNHVTLVDAARGGLREISGNRLRVDGSDYEADCLVFATGFEWNTPYVNKIGFYPVGRGGMSLGEKWRNGPRTLHGVMTNGFPNLFIIPLPNSQSVVTENFAHSIQENAGHIARIVAATAGQGMAAVEATAEAEDEWCRIILQRRRDDAAFLEACTPGRSNSEGHPELRSPLSSNFGGDVFEFFGLLADWRNERSLPGLHLSPG
ncbi:cupin domain-containing protein [Streptomyces sp. NBC_01716]|uniref:cupin domain-containing protein n=1 Tax=Streptomyces sp. NBC_01716 TaxID=2975917 RepID=UPI002E3590C7|nr:cupin domain-containing protein [Streptomyces sp. NBC_01716]